MLLFRNKFQICLFFQWIKHIIELLNFENCYVRRWIWTSGTNFSSLKNMSFKKQIFLTFYWPTIFKIYVEEFKC